MPFDSHRVVMPEFATSLEMVNDEPKESFEETIELAEGAEFLVATLTLPNGQQPPWDLGRLELRGARYYSEQLDNDAVYINQRGSIAVLNEPQGQTWTVRYSPGPIVLPVAVNFMAFHRRSHGSSPRILPATSAGSTFKCRSCKITAKALALAIVAAAALPAIPAALIAAVAAYLGVGTVIAAAFIGSVIGDTADIIAEKLCKKIGLC